MSLILSVLAYSDTVWDPFLQKDIDQLEADQRRSVRFVCQDYSRHSSVSSMMKRLELTALADLKKTAPFNPSIQNSE